MSTEKIQDCNDSLSSSEEYDPSEQLADEDTRQRVTPESIIMNLFQCLFSDNDYGKSNY